MAPLLIAAHAADSAQAPASGAKVVMKHALPAVDFSDSEVTVVEVSYPPKGASPSHRHSGLVIVYVLEGEVRSQVEGEPERTYGKGEMFYEPPGHIHVVSRNASDTKPAKILAVLIAEKNKPVTIPVPAKGI